MAYTHITPGWEIEMSAHYYSDKNADRVAELIQLPREELAAMEEASVAKEKTIFSKCSEIETEWKKQAEEKQARGETLTPEEQMRLNYQPQPSMSYEEMLEFYQGKAFEMFGTNEQAYLDYYDSNKDWFYGGEGIYELSVDVDANSSSIPNNDLSLLVRAICEWEQGGDVE